MSNINIRCLILCSILACPASQGFACTTVVVSGRATVDGRPLLWKNRDTWQQQNEVIYDDQGKYAFVGVVNAEASLRIWMGTNEAGLSIENSLSRDLDDGDSHGPGNGTLIRRALESCATVAEFEQLLISTNESGRSTQGNFGLIDAHGGAMMFEVAPRSFRRYNANDPAVAPQGFIVRANASIAGSTTDPVRGNANAEVLEMPYSSRRYCRARDLCRRRLVAGKIDAQFLLQMVARDVDGFVPKSGELSRMINTSRALNRNTTVSAVVFHGVLPGESPLATTMWTMLGEPHFSVAVPVWVAQRKISTQLNGAGTSPICDLAIELRRRNYETLAERGDEYLITKNIADIRRHVLQVESKSLRGAIAAKHLG